MGVPGRDARRQAARRAHVVHDPAQPRCRRDDRDVGTRIRRHRGATRRRPRPSAGPCTSRSGAVSRNRRSSTCASTRAASRRAYLRALAGGRAGRRAGGLTRRPTRASRPSRRGFVAAGDAPGARSLADALLRDAALATGDRVAALVLRARAHEARRDLAQAIVDLEGALALDPSQARRLERARARVRRRGHERPRDRGVRARRARRSRLRARVEQPRQRAARRGPHRRRAPRGSSAPSRPIRATRSRGRTWARSSATPATMPAPKWRCGARWSSTRTCAAR